MAGRTFRSTDKAVIHGCRCNKAYSGMTGITGGNNRNMGNRWANGQNAIVTGLALGGKYFEYTTNMTRLTTNQVMLAC